MPKEDVIVNLPVMVVRKWVGHNPLVAEVVYKGTIRCAYCESKRLRKKSRYTRLIQHVGIGHRRLWLRVVCYKYQCYDCGRYFNQRLPGVLPYQRVSESLKEQTFYWHTQGVSQRDLSKNIRRASSTIERWYHQYYERFHRELEDRECPRVLGIDEHSFNRRSGFATTLCNLEKHQVFDVVKGRSEQSLQSYLLSLKGRERVRVVCMDLSSTYRNIVRRYFPNAKIVADRFHVIRLLQQMFLNTCGELHPELKYQRGLLPLLRTKSEKLTPRQYEKREHYFREHPAIASVFEFKEKLYRLLMQKHQRAKHCKRLIPLLLDYIQQLKRSPFKWLASLGKHYSSGKSLLCVCGGLRRTMVLPKASIAR